MALAAGLTVLGISLFLVQEAFRRAGKWLAWGAFLLLPILLTPHWVRINSEVGVFLWVKLYTILFGVCWITGLRYTSLGRERWPLLGVLVLLVINVLEAVVQDLVSGTLAHYLVALSGVLLLLSLPRRAHAIRIDENPSQDLVYHDMTRSWIMAYSLWNAAFVYLNFPIVAGHHLAVLGAAFAVGMYDPRRWLMARAYTLAFDMLLLATFRVPLTDAMDTSDWLTPDGAYIVAILCAGAVACCTARLMVDHGMARRSPRNDRPRRAMTRRPGSSGRQLPATPTVNQGCHAEQAMSSVSSS